MSMAAHNPALTERYHAAISPPDPEIYHVQQPEQTRVNWRCPASACHGTVTVAVVLSREISTGHAMRAWVRCPRCDAARVYRLSQHAYARYRDRVDEDARHALRHLVSGRRINTRYRTGLYHPETGALFPVRVDTNDQYSKVIATTTLVSTPQPHHDHDNT